ncbi:hypothetical protein AB0C69_38990, partial [Actinomadura sp. NPDC048032]|uniref:hypothetical protein n=1 Tax=Actinomadura sp. NPDC048032 TaxID=3155747 RepID=UPI0034019785
MCPPSSRGVRLRYPLTRVPYARFLPRSLVGRLPRPLGGPARHVRTGIRAGTADVQADVQVAGLGLAAFLPGLSHPSPKVRANTAYDLQL